MKSSKRETTKLEILSLVNDKLNMRDGGFVEELSVREDRLIEISKSKLVASAEGNAEMILT